MSVYKIGDVWRYEVFLNGRRAASASGFSTKREAQQEHDAKKAALRERPEVKSHTFEDLLAHFRNWHLPKVRPGTKRRYEVDIKERIEPFFRFRRLDDITGTLIEEFMRDCQKSLKPKSVNNCLHTLRLMLNKAERWKLIKESPYDLESLKVPKEAYVWWDKEEHIQAFLKAAEQSRYYALYLTALETGLRYAEIIGLTVGDVDLQQGTIHVHCQWLEKERRYAPTKHGKERWVDFGTEGRLAMALRQHVAGHERSRPVFVTAAGHRPTRGGVAHKYFKACIRRAGVPEICFHGLRHTFASWYLKTHDNVSDLQAILGHSNITTTMRYAHHSKRARRKPLDLASITQNSRTISGEREETSENLRGKGWRDGRDLNPHLPEKTTVA